MRHVQQSSAARAFLPASNASSPKESRPLALPAVAAAVQAASREAPSRKLTINDFPAILRRDAAFDF
jgi:hypothetical protein